MACADKDGDVSRTSPRDTLATPLSAPLAVLLVLGSGLIAALVATSTRGEVTAPWWTLAVVIAAVLPLGSWRSSASSRGRLLATAALLLACLLFVGGLAISTSTALVAIVVAPLWFAVGGMITPLLRGHRALSLAVFAAPVVMTAAAAPAAVGSSTGLGPVHLSTALDAVGGASGPVLLLGGAAMLIGSVVDLLLRLRATVSPTAVRSVSALLTGLALALVGVAGVVSAGSATSAGRFGSVGALVATAAVLAVVQGARGLRNTEIGLAGGAMTALAVTAVLVGALLLPGGVLVTASGLALLLVLAGSLGSVAGLCGAAALLRSRPRLSRPSMALPVPVRLPGVLTQRLAQTTATLRTRYTTS